MDIYATREKMRVENINFMQLPLRVAYYARVSTEFMEQLNSLDNQIKYFSDYIGDNPNWEFIDGYIDEGISGITTQKRERFNQMIEDAKLGKFDLIVTKEVSRFARNTLDSIKYTRELLNNGVAVFFQNDAINTIEKDSELRLTIMSSMAQDESRKISERVKWGHRQSIKNGVVLGNSQIYGYQKLNKRLVIDETQAPMVRELFEMYATGKYSMKQLEQYFWDKGFRNTKGKKLNHSTMGNIITNPKYKGYYVGHKVIITDLFTKKQKFLPEDEWVMYKDETGDIVPAIVSEEIWEEANRVFKMRSEDVKTRQNKTVHQNLLTGKLICAHCGTAYYRKDSKRKDGTVNSTWRCSNKINNGKDACPSCSIYEHEIVPILEDVFKHSRRNITELTDRMEEVSKQLLEGDDVASRIAELNKLIENEEKKKMKILQFSLNGVYQESDVIKLTDMCNKVIEQHQAEIEFLTDKLKSKKDMKAELDEVKRILKLASESLKAGEIDRPFVDRFIEKILVYPEENTMRLEIHLYNGQIVNNMLCNSRGRSGHTSKKMIKAYEESMK
jgi:DNA invertase Pin-like site-specific DNA recombinase